MLAIAGGKGGCGKTTTAAGLARALAARGRDPVVVDADVDAPALHVVATGNHRPGVATDSARERESCAGHWPPTPGIAALADGEALSTALWTGHDLPGVALVPAIRADEDDAARALVRLRDAVDLVVVDVPAGAARTVAGPLRIADAAVLVSTPTRCSLVDAAKTAAMARALDTPVIGLVLTRSDGPLDPSPLLDCPTIGHVPGVTEPLNDYLSRREYEKIARYVNRHNI